MIGTTIPNIEGIAISASNHSINKQDKNALGITFTSVGTSFSNVQNMAVSHKNINLDLGTSSSNLSSNKLETVLAGITFTIIGTSYSGIGSLGISQLNMINQVRISSGSSPVFGVSIANVDAKVGTLIGITTVNYEQRIEIVLPNSFTTIGASAFNRNA